MSVEIPELQQKLKDFAIERQWCNFHSPKNLAMALTAEVGELVEIFQWLTEEESRDVMTNTKTAEHVRHELADVFAYLLQLAAAVDVDLTAALNEKIELNAQKYPAHSRD